MKKLWKEVISISLAGVVLAGSMPLAGAAYAEYLPTVQQFVVQQEGELNRCSILYISGEEPYAEDPNERMSGTLMGMNGDFAGVWTSTTWGSEEEDLAWWARAMCGIAESVEIAVGVEHDNEIVTRQNTDYTIRVNALAPLSIPTLSTQQWIETEPELYRWEIDLGNGYPVGQYELSIMKTDSLGNGTGRSFTGEVSATNEPLIMQGNASEIRTWDLSECNIIFQRATFLGLSSDSKTAIYEATLPQNSETTIPTGPEVPEEPEENYIYDEVEPGKTIDFAGMLDNVTDETSAVDAVDKALTEVTDEQKQSVTGIDKLTLLAEEAAAKANTVSVDSGVINVTSGDIPATADSALTATTGVLFDAGVNMQRNPRAIVNYDAGSSETVSVTTEIQNGIC